MNNEQGQNYLSMKTVTVHGGILAWASEIDPEMESY
jgi:hypothetical protein